MAKPTTPYTNLVAPAIDAGNLNEVNNVIYSVLGDGVNAPANASNVRTNIGLGTMATQNANNVAITGGTITGVSVGGLIGVQRFTASGTYTPTPGTNKVIIECVGGGGAGGGANTTGAGQYSMGSGGASGGYSVGLFTSGFSGAPVTVGAGGAGQLGNVGLAGGTSSVGTLISAAGGGGGSIIPASAGPSLAGGGVPGVIGTITGGTVIKLSQGQAGNVSGFATAATQTAYGVQGAPSPISCSGTNVTANADGATPVTGAFGAGGGGASNNASSGVNRTGGPGAAGVVIIYEFS